MESIVFVVLIWIVSSIFSKDNKKKQTPPPKPVFREEDRMEPSVRPVSRRAAGPERPEPVSYEQMQEKQRELKRRLRQKHAPKSPEGTSMQGPTLIQIEAEQKKASMQGRSTATAARSVSGWPRDHAPHEGYCEIDKDLYVEGAAASLPDVETVAPLEPQDFNARGLVAAVILKEVLDKPLALRPNRR